MDYSGLSESALEPSLIVRDGLAVRQWEIYLTAVGRDRSTDVWLSPSLVAVDRWLIELWRETRRPDRRGGVPSRADPSPGGVGLLTAHQSRALWSEVVRDSSLGRKLISPSGAAAPAQRAHHLLGHWRVPATALTADPSQPGLEAFLTWSRQYRERLRDAGWTDRIGILDRLLAAPAGSSPRAARLLDLPDPTPAQSGVVERLRASGWTISGEPPVRARARARAVELGDPDEELDAAVSWAAGQLQRKPTTRVALVVPGLDDHRGTLDALLDDALAEIGAGGQRAGSWVHGSGALAAIPAIGAALTALELLSAQGTFIELSRWLRSPFFEFESSDEASRSALLETQLRGALGAQLGFRNAYDTDLADTLRKAVPHRAHRLEQALRTADGQARPATPTGWIDTWQRALTQLGWTGSQALEPPDVVDGWEAGLAELAQLTPIVGAVSGQRALHELRAIVARRRLPERIPAVGVSVLEHIDDVGPGYDAIWVTGFTERRWPEPVTLNPLLPRQLQLEQRMPGSSPELSLRAARRSVARLLAGASEVVFSWPKRIGEEPAERSTLLGGIDATSAEQIASETRSNGRSGPASATLEPAADPVPPFTAAVIGGGARTLDLQAACPLRAFCETRLGARELEPIARGVPPNVQGMIVHKALELLLQPTLGRADFDVEPLVRAVPGAVARALREAFGAAREPLDVLLGMEQARVERLLVEFLARESQRPPFTPWDVERRIQIEVDVWSLAARIDRVDRLSDGSVAIIDYKTGSNLEVADWFRARPLDCQLPLYALTVGSAVSALIVVDLRDEAVEYRGVGPANLGTRLRRLPEGRTWEQQLGRWREQIATLLGEYAAGDARIFAANPTLAAGAYAPLTRVYEVLGDAEHGPAP